MNVYGWLSGCRIVARTSRWTGLALAAWACAPETPPDESGMVLEVTPDELTFPETAVGSEAESRQLTITNHALVDVSLAAPSIEAGTAFSLGEVDPSALLLGPGGALAVTVDFVPDESGRRGDVVTFSEAGGGQPVSVELWGEGVAPQAWLSPSSYPFGDVVLSAEPSIEVQLGNVGNAPLRVEYVEFDGGGFTLLQPDIIASTIGTELLPGEEFRIVVGVASDAVGEVAARLDVTTDDPVRPTQSTDLSANVVTAMR